MPGKSKHSADCACLRCAGFKAGNTVAVKHGAYATLQLRPRVAELADALRPAIPDFQGTDELALRLLCLALTRVEAVEVAFSNGEEVPLRLEQDLRGWLNSARRLAADLGLNPSSRSAIRANLARVQLIHDRLNDPRRFTDAEALANFATDSPEVLEKAR